MDHAEHAHHRFNPDRAQRLNDPSRLRTQIGEKDLLRLLDLHGDENVADLGSGTGFYTDIVAAHTTGLVYAVEVSPAMHEAYTHRGLPLNVRQIEADLQDLALPPGSIDVAYSISVLHEADGDLGMAGLLPALRPPGRVVIVDWRREPASWESGPPAAIRVSDEAVQRLFEPHFESVTLEHLGDFMFALVARGRRTQAA